MNMLAGGIVVFAFDMQVHVTILEEKDDDPTQHPFWDNPVVDYEDVPAAVCARGGVRDR